MMNLCGSKSYGRLSILLTVLLAMLCASPAAAFQFNLGDINGSLDSTLSYGASWRVSKQDKDIIGLQEGGTAYSHNFDDGNLNYDQGDLISSTTKLTSELALDYNNFGLFVRGSAFYDFEYEEGERARTELTSDALDLVGSDIDLLDAYVWWNFEAGDTLGQLRVGDQVLSWGESTFIQNGINVINPFDVSKLRVPGSELKEGLVPVGMVTASISPSENLTFEAFYQYDWEKVEIDPTGSYWSTNDFVGEGGDKVMLGFGQIHDNGAAPVEETFLGVPIAPDIYADDDGQYGLAMRVYAPELNDTEFGFFFMNYHSRLPVLSSWTGDGAGATAAGTIAAVTPNIIGSPLTPGTGVLGGQSPAALIAAYTPMIGAEAATAIVGATAQTFAATNDYAAAGAAGAKAASAFAQDAFAKTARVQIEYPEDIKLFGVSFNTVLPKSGVALQGEISHRRDVPLQVDDLELLFATLGPINPDAAAKNQLATYGGADTTLAALMANLGDPIYTAGYKRLDVTQVQTTATKLFGPTMGADQFTMVGEIGWTHIHGMPSKNDLRFEGPGTPISGNSDLANLHYNEIEPSSAFADVDSWGYRMVGKLDFNDALGAVTLSPRIAWSHDVSGTSPGPGGNFIEGRKAVTFGLGASYQSTWSADLSYTDFFGAHRYNLVNDRDFIALNIKYSF